MGRIIAGIGAAVTLSLSLAVTPLIATDTAAATSPAASSVADPAVVEPDGGQSDAPVPTTQTPVLPQRCVPDGGTLSEEPGPCRITRFGAKRPTVVVWGDSHAWQQLPAMTTQARKTRTNLVAFVMGACPPMDLRGTGYRGACVTQGVEALALITAKVRRDKPVTVVLGGFWQLYRGLVQRSRAGWTPEIDHDRFLLTRAEMFARGGGRTFATLGRRHVTTAAIAQMPHVAQDAPPCAAGEQPYACDLPRTTAIPDEARTAAWVKARLARIRRSGYLDPTRFLCTADVCRAALRGAPVYLDSLHLDPAITGAFAPEYRALFR